MTLNLGKQERSAAATTSAACYMSPSSWYKKLPYPPRRPPNSSTVRGSVSVESVRKHVKRSKSARQYHRQVCNRMPTCAQMLSPRARHLTAITCHLDDVGAPVTEVPLRNSPQGEHMETRHPAQSTSIGGTDGSKKKSRMISIFAASEASTSESNMWNKLQEMISSGAGNGRK